MYYKFPTGVIVDLKGIQALFPIELGKDGFRFKLLLKGIDNFVFINYTDKQSAEADYNYISNYLIRQNYVSDNKE